jgi:hypothetical protein
VATFNLGCLYRDSAVNMTIVLSIVLKGEHRAAELFQAASNM